MRVWLALSLATLSIYPTDNRRYRWWSATIAPLPRDAWCSDYQEDNYRH